MEILFKDGEENSPIVESIDKKDTSIFKDQYAQAYQVWTRMVSAKARLSDNNIIAFCGDRGSGKTSCMQSFIEQLKQSDTNNLYVDPIDPSFFDDSHSILELVIGQLYMNLNDNAARILDNEQANKDDLLVEFDKIIRNLKYLAKSVDRERFYDAIEELESLAAGLQLKKHIEQLFTHYLEYNKKKDGLLVIPIDDLDLNISDAYIMSEYIRKYLMNSKCIIIVGLRVEQLIEAIKQHIKDEHRNISDADIAEMAVKYTVKFLPMSNRIAMPVFENYFDSKLEIQKADNRIETFHSVQEAVVKLIFNKTGYLFYNSKGGSSLIIPRNLRSLRQLLHLLNAMPNRTKADPRSLHENQRIFKDYFFNTWTTQLSQEYQNKVKTILNVDNDISFNKVVAMQLVDKASNQLFEQITNSANYAYNVSVGDVFCVIDRLKQNDSDRQLQLFIFFIMSLYSMKLYEAYDSITETTNLENSLFPMQADADADNVEIYASDVLFDQANKLQRLVNGQYFYYKPNEILPPFKRNKPRDLTLIDGNLLGKGFRSIIEEINLADGSPSEDLKNEFKMYEFFFLTSSRYVQIKRLTDSYDKNRESPLPVHLQSYNSQTKNIVFDVLSPFYNILNLKTAYNRFTDYINGNVSSLYDLAKSLDWSLLNSLLNIDEREYPNKYHNLFSDAVIRNAEVIDAIFENARLNRTKKYSSDNRQCIKDFYERIVKTGMRTYSDANGKNSYIIHFGFLKCISEALPYFPQDKFDQIFSEEVVLDDWREAFRTNKTIKGSAVIKKLKVQMDQLYSKMSVDEWQNIFELDKPYKQAEIISIIEHLLKQD
jgi:hypothetical protein